MVKKRSIILVTKYFQAYLKIEILHHLFIFERMIGHTMTWVNMKIEFKLFAPNWLWNVFVFIFVTNWNTNIIEWCCAIGQEMALVLLIRIPWYLTGFPTKSNVTRIALFFHYFFVPQFLQTLAFSNWPSAHSLHFQNLALQHLEHNNWSGALESALSMQYVHCHHV